MPGRASSARAMSARMRPSIGCPGVSGPPRCGNWYSRYCALQLSMCTRPKAHEYPLIPELIQEGTHHQPAPPWRALNTLLTALDPAEHPGQGRLLADEPPPVGVGIPGRARLRVALVIGVRPGEARFHPARGRRVRGGAVQAAGVDVAVDSHLRVREVGEGRPAARR